MRTLKRPAPSAKRHVDEIRITIYRPMGSRGKFELVLDDYSRHTWEAFRFGKRERLRTGLDVGDYIRDRIKKLERGR